MKKFNTIFIKILCTRESVLIKLLVLCPFMPNCLTATHGLSLGLVTIFVLFFTNIIVTILCNYISNEIRIPIYIIIIILIIFAMHLLSNKYSINLDQSLIILIPLMIINCIIINITIFYASKNNFYYAIINSLIMGFYATIALFFLGSIREILGNGTLFDGANLLLGEWAKILRIEFININSPFLLAILPPGAFIGLGFMIAAKYLIDKKIKNYINK